MPPLTDGPAGDEPSAEDAAAEEISPAEIELRRHPSTIGGAIYLLILVVTLVGLVIAATGAWRGGVHCMAGALLAAALARGVLPARDAGMLAVRQRWFDVVLLVVMGVGLWVLASSIPG